MAVTADRPAPYAPTKAILGIIDRYRHRGMASPISADVLARAGISDSLISRTLQALVTLDLINEDGVPTPTFEGIRLAPEAEYKKRLEDWLTGAYADVFSYVDPARDDETRIRDAFRTYQPVAQQPRMVSLFQGLCDAAGLVPEKTTRSSRPAPAPVGTPRLRAAARRIVAERFKDVPRYKPDSVSGLPPSLAGLLASLPSAEDGWTNAEREKFLTTFRAVLDFCIPIIGDDADETETAAEQKRAAASAPPTAAPIIRRRV
jgi:hypothetical protein